MSLSLNEGQGSRLAGGATTAGFADDATLRDTRRTGRGAGSAGVGSASTEVGTSTVTGGGVIGAGERLLSDERTVKMSTITTATVTAPRRSEGTHEGSSASSGKFHWRRNRMVQPRHIPSVHEIPSPRHEAIPNVIGYPW